MTSSVVGSWFPTGYHGHFRSKSRNDFICEYRQLAKPQPPERFMKRSMQPSSNHVFSHHDNRQSFLRDALIFEQGLGRKRVANQTYSFKPEFITWMPEREYVMKTLRPQVSTYKIDFRQDENIPQLLVKRPQTSFDSIPTTTYRYAHGRDSPNKEVIDAMNNKALSLTAHSRRLRPKTAKPQYRETVASCLNWYVPKPPVRPRVPSATQLTDFENQTESTPVKQEMMQQNGQDDVIWPTPQAVQEMAPQTVQEIAPPAADPAPPTVQVVVTAAE